MDFTTASRLEMQGTKTDVAGMSSRTLLRFCLCLALCLGLGYASGRATTPEIATWYAALVKPWWTPPNWVFPVVWTLLYAMMGVSLWLFWETPAGASRRWVLSSFFAQLALNAAWSPVFFGLHAIQAGLLIIVALAVMLTITIYQGFGVNRGASWLLVPYLVWVLYASTLNGGIVALNI